MILQELKQQTRTYHIEIENQLIVLNHDLSLEQYKALLQRFWGFYLPVEARLSLIMASTPFAAEIEIRKKVPLLTRDLEVIDKSGAGVTGLPICENLPELARLSQAFGCLYVLEGSTLGGQIIARHIKERFNFDRNNGCSFFNCYGKEVGPRWKTFSTMLTSYASTSNTEKIIIDAARDTFITLRNWLVGEVFDK
jgi:heme oxygenase